MKELLEQIMYSYNNGRLINMHNFVTMIYYGNELKISEVFDYYCYFMYSETKWRAV